MLPPHHLSYPLTYLKQFWAWQLSSDVTEIHLQILDHVLIELQALARTEKLVVLIVQCFLLGSNNVFNPTASMAMQPCTVFLYRGERLCFRLG